MWSTSCCSHGRLCRCTLSKFDWGIEGAAETAAAASTRQEISTFTAITINRGEEKQETCSSGEKDCGKDERADSRFVNEKDKQVNVAQCSLEGGTPPAEASPSAMPLVLRTLLFAFVTLVVVLLIIDDIAEVEEETANTGHSKSNLHLLIPKPHRKSTAHVDPTAVTNLSKDTNSLSLCCNNTARLSSNSWTFNKTLSNLIRKNILRFLDPERDISILKGTLKPGDIIHYVFDRHSTTNISENLYRLLPTASPMKNQHHRRCAIVGNSGILLNSSCGPEIDSHDFVIRCNLAPVEDYYQDVGWRTNLVTMNPSVVQRAFQDLVSEEWRDRFLQRLQSLSGSVLWIPAFMAKGGEERVEWALRLILLHTVDVRTAFPSLRLLHAVRGYWLTNNVHIKRPTTGLLMYTMATRFCEEIHLYGFWPFPLDPQGRPVKYHYYDTLKYEYTSSSSPHTMPLEFRTLSTLHRQGALQLHTGACDGEGRVQTELQSKKKKNGSQ